MSSMYNEIPPGTDLCQIPSANPPLGVLPNFNDPNPPLKSVTISLGIIFTTIGVIFGLGRLYANIRKLTLGDLFVLLAILSNGATAVLTITSVKYFQHQWNIPVCWLDESFNRLSFAWEILTIFGLFFAKTATLLLLKQLFSVSRAMRIAIWIGIAITVVLYTESAILSSYYASVKARHSYELLYNSIAQGVGGTALDTYIFILPLRQIYHLNLSKRRKIHILAVFATAALGVVASIASLAYRIISAKSSSGDLTYNTGLLLNFNLVEMNAALIVSSTAGFAKFMGNHVVPQFNNARFVLATKFGFGGGGRPFDKLDEVHNPNRPRTGLQQVPGAGMELKDTKKRMKMGDTWLLRSETTVVDMEGGVNTT